MRCIRYTALSLVAFLFACAPGKSAFLEEQICLPTPEDLSAFTGEMKSFAKANDMKFIDGSAETQRDLAAIATSQMKAEITKSPVVNMGIERADGMGMTIGNLGLPFHQYAFGFSEGADPEQAHKVADRFVTKVSKHWHLEKVPDGMGARGMKQCGDVP